MLRFFLMLPLCLWFTMASALNFDSLWGVWNDKTQPDTNRLKAMKQIAWDGYIFSQPDSAFYFAGLAYKLAAAVDNNYWMADALNTKGVTFYIQGNYDQALSYYSKSLEIAEEIGDKKGMASSYNNMGIICQDKSNYNQALDYHSKSLEIRAETSDEKGMASSYNNMGIIYYNQDNYEQALDFFQKAQKINEALGDKQIMVNTYTNMGSICYEQGNYKEAHSYYQKSLQLLEETADKKAIANTYTNVGITYFAQGNYKQARSYYQKSLKIGEEIGDKTGMSVIYINLGLLALKQEFNGKALSFGNKGLDLAQQVGVVKETKEASELLYKVYKIIGQPSKALEMHELYIEMHDSLNSIENTKATIKQQMQFEYEIKAASDSIKNAEASKLTKAQLAAQRAENVRQQQQAYFLYAGLALTLLFGGFIFNRLRVTRRQKKMIEKQKELVEEQKKDITDSIRYAENIQQALLPTIENLKEVLPDGFVLFQPKDIVSGDFYWMQHHNGLVYLAVCDCTGHGVPGAFMSMIGSSLLDESVVEKGITTPNEIFHEVRMGFINALKQNEEDESQKDGMDAALISWDKKNTLQAAAALNPVLIIRNGEIRELKPDRHPVGYLTENQEAFTHHEVQLEKGDSVYLFTDGYHDQFGGPNHKKFMMRNFKNLLLSIQDKTMNEQKTILEDTMKEWKGDTDQIDDILVMGVRF